jgi:hypothetical protein
MTSIAPVRPGQPLRQLSFLDEELEAPSSVDSRDLDLNLQKPLTPLKKGSAESLQKEREIDLAEWNW